jgi:hypothetical protein
MQILALPASPAGYKLAQTYTTTSTYTVPNGVSLIAGIAIATGANGASGQNSSSGNGGAGGGGGGGGAVIGFWNYAVTAGQTWLCTLNVSGSSIGANFDGNSFVSAGAGTNGSGTIRGVGGTTSAGSNIPSNTRAFANGGNGGNGGALQFTNGNGNDGFNANSGSLWTPVSFPYSTSGLPTNIYSGSGGGGGGGGARDANGFLYFIGGSVGSPNGGQGGFAAEDFNLNGFSGGNGAVMADGGGGGGGGAFQFGYGAGSGGGAGTGNAGVIYIYEFR